MAKKPAAKAGGPKGGRGPKTKPTVPGASGVVGTDHNGPPAASRLTAADERELFLSHRKSWIDWQAKVKVLGKLEADIKAALKADGFTVRQFQIADLLVGGPKGEAKVSGEVKDRLRVAYWMGHPMGAQLDLFGQADRTPSTDRAFDQGQQDSMENKPCRPAHAPETEQYRAYMAGYQQHQAKLAGGIKTLAAEAGAEAAAPETPPPDSGERVSRSEFRRRLGQTAAAGEELAHAGGEPEAGKPH